MAKRNSGARGDQTTKGLVATLSGIGAPMFGRKLKKLRESPAAETQPPAHDVSVYNVREFKGALSQILNDAASGETSAVVTSGSGLPVVVVGGGAFMEAVSAHEPRQLTMSEARAQLPFAPGKLPKFQLRGHAPTRGMLRAASRSNG